MAVVLTVNGERSGARLRRPSKKGEPRFALRLQQNIKTKLAEWTGLEPATPGVTGRYSNQLNYHSRMAMRQYVMR